LKNKSKNGYKEKDLNNRLIQFHSTKDKD